MNTYNHYAHSGDIGDLIYGLALAQEVGPIDLTLFPVKGKTTVLMSEARAKRLFKLLEYQPYIRSVKYADYTSDTSWNGFRDHHHLHGGQNLADCHISTHGLSWKIRTKKWLYVPSPIITTQVVINWTHRYHNWDFPWRDVIQEYEGDITFLGMKSELDDFNEKYCKGLQPPAYLGSKCFMEIAQVIAGAKLYIGNLTGTTAIAEAMKKPMIVEGYHGSPAHDFQRLDCLIVYKPRIEFPSLASLE